MNQKRVVKILFNKSKIICLKINKSIRYSFSLGFPDGSVGKESACNAGDLGSIPGLGWSPGEGYGNPLQYSGLENSMDRGDCQAIVWTRYSWDFPSDPVVKIHFLVKELRWGVGHDSATFTFTFFFPIPFLRKSKST